MHPTASEGLVVTIFWRGKSRLHPNCRKEDTIEAWIDRFVEPDGDIDVEQSDPADSTSSNDVRNRSGLCSRTRWKLFEMKMSTDGGDRKLFL